MNISDRATATRILRSFDSTGAKIPKAVHDAYQTALNAADAADRLGGNITLAPAVLAALKEDRDPTNDPAVHQAIAAERIAAGGLERDIQALAFQEFRGVCRANADSIITAWRVPFMKAGKAMSEAHATLGAISLADTRAAVERGGTSAEAWLSAQAAVNTVEAVVEGWTALALFVGFTVPPDSRPLRFCDPGPWFDPKLTPWAAVQQDTPLSLPTFAQFRSRLASIAAGREPVPPIDAERSHIAGRPINMSA